MNRPVIILHGGAGDLKRELISPERETLCLETMRQALVEGWQILSSGGDSLSAVEQTVRVMEDSGIFNAGRGSFPTDIGTIENDASIMDGETLRAGGVAMLSLVKNPISAARAVMEHTSSVLLIGDKAKSVALGNGGIEVDDSYYNAVNREEQLKSIGAGTSTDVDDVSKSILGTVGAVALDMQGHLASATSTGGILSKPWGRVGDTPIIGSGTYAHDGVVAVSCTGYGEYFMRGVTAFDVFARMKYAGESIESASDRALSEVTRMGGRGGLIAVDGRGQFSLPFSTPGMFRGWKNDADECVLIW